MQYKNNHETKAIPVDNLTNAKKKKKKRININELNHFDSK